MTTTISEQKWPLYTIIAHCSIPRSLVADFLYQHRVAFDGAVSEVEILDTSNCAVSYHSDTVLLLTLAIRYQSPLTKGSIRLKPEARIANEEIYRQT